LPGVEETRSPGKTAEIGKEGKIPKKENRRRGRRRSTKKEQRRALADEGGQVRE
jgi:hypothetical protein